MRLLCAGVCKPLLHGKTTTAGWGERGGLKPSPADPRRQVPPRLPPSLPAGQGPGSPSGRKETTPRPFLTHPARPRRLRRPRSRLAQRPRLAPPAAVNRPPSPPPTTPPAACQGGGGGRGAIGRRAAKRGPLPRLLLAEGRESAPAHLPPLPLAGRAGLAPPPRGHLSLWGEINK